MSLRSRAAITIAFVTAIAVGAPAVAFDASRRSAAHAAERSRLSYAALDLVSLARTENGKLNIDRFSAVQPRPGQPVSLFIDGKGRQLDGDLTENARFRTAALRRARTGDIAPVRIGDRLVVAEAIASSAAPDEIAAVAVSWLDATATDGAVAADSRTRFAIAAGWWLAVTLVLSAVLLRLLGRPLDDAQAERTFFADAAHELKTPWAIVRARADAARRAVTTAAAPGTSAAPSPPATPADDLAAISTTATAAGRTIDEMLTLARLDRGVLGEQVRLRLDSVADTCVSEALDHHGNHLDVALEPAPAAVVRGDEALLRHAISNLLENAIRHGDPPIRVQITRAGGRVRLSVIDSGAGIAPSQRELVFERFHRATNRGTSGSGLGLSIARSVVRAHGGKLTYRERPETHGSIFTIELPVA